MRFKDFITRQRVAIFIIGVALFTLSLLIAHAAGLSSLWGDLSVDLAASSVTIIFTALIIDYLGLKEQSNRTKNVASLGEEEIRATCYRIKMRLAWLFGLEREILYSARQDIATRQDVQEFLEYASKIVDDYLQDNKFTDKATKVDVKSLPRYMERLEMAQAELEQTLILYEYVIPLPIRERVLKLRSELQTSDRLLGFIEDFNDLNKSNFSLIRFTAQSVYDALQEVLDIM